MSQCPDLVPPLAAYAALRRGTTRITNAGRLRLKESDRLASVTEVLNALGSDVTEGADFFANGKIFTVDISHKTCSVKAKSTIFVDEIFLNGDTNDIGNKHIVSAKGNDLLHLTFNTHGTFGYTWSANVKAFLGGNAKGLELVNISTTFYTATVHGSDKI